MATTFDITGRINAVVSSGSLRMLKKLQVELRATAKALMQMGETATASALGHTAMAMDRVAAGMNKVTEGAKKTAESTTKTAKAMTRANVIAEKSQGIYAQVAEGYKLNAAEAGALHKAVGRLGQKYGYAASMQKEWVPTLKSSLDEIYKQKAALVASGKAITTHVSSQELFDRTNKKLASGLHSVSGKFTDYDTAMAKSLGRSPAFRKEVDKIAGAVGKQGESFKSQFAALTKADDLWRKHVTTLHRSGKITTDVANKMYAASEHLNMPLDRLRANIKATVPQVSLFSRAMSSLVAHLKSFASYAAAASIISGIAGTFGLATRAIIQYDQALHDLQAITRATDDETVLMGEKIREIGRTTKFSASEVAVAMRTLGQAGFTASEAVSSIGAVANLATGTLTSMKTVVDLVTTAIRAFDLKATETGRVTDVFANAVNRSKLTIDKLRIAFNYIGPIAAKAGISFEETNTTMMMLANSGIRASTIGTGLRRTFQQLIDPTKELKAAIEAAGYTVEDFNPQFNDMRDVIRRLTEVVPDAESAFKLFSLRSASAVAALSSQGVAAFDSLHSSVLRSGSAAEMAEKQMEGLGIIFKQAWDNAHDLALALGEAGVNGALRTLGKGLKAVFVGLRMFVESGIGKAIIAVAGFAAGLYGIIKVWGLLKFAVWGQSVLFFAKQLLFAKTASEALAVVGTKLNMTFIYLAAAVAVAYGAYKIYNSVLGEVSKVSTKYIDVLNEAHKEELKRLENIKRLVSIVRDESETNRGRLKALAELSEKGVELNLVLREEASETENLTENILNNKDALDRWAQAFDDYSEKAIIENLEAQVNLFEKTEIAIKKVTSSTTFWGKISKKLTSETAQGLARMPLLGGLVGDAFLLVRKKIDACREANKALESQQGEAYEKMVTAVSSFGEVTQKVWKDYMLRAGASEEEVAKLFVDGEEKITQAHLEAYLRIQLARKDMTKAEKVELEKHLNLVGDLYGKIYSTTALELEKGLKTIREHYSERKKVVTEFYDSDVLYLKGKLGFEAGVYEKLLGLARRHSATKLSLLNQSYEDIKNLIKSKNLGMIEEQEKLAEEDKKFVNQKIALERWAAETLRVLAEEQLGILATSYEESSVAYDESVAKKIESVDRYYAYEKEKAELQITDAKVLAETLVELEAQRFDDLLEIGEQATKDRLWNEERYHEEVIHLIEEAKEEAKIQFEEGGKEHLKIERDLNAKLIETDRSSVKARIEILKGWSATLSAQYTEAVENTRRYANEVISIENEIKEIRKKAAEAIVSVNVSTQDRILRIHRAGMSERQIITSKIQEAQRKLAEADYLASKVGTEEALTRAKKLYGEAQNIYTELGVKAAGAAKEGKNIGITHQEAERQVSGAGNKIIGVLEKEKEASIAAKEAELLVAEQAQKSWADLAKDIKVKIGDIQTDISYLTGEVDDLISSIDGLEDKEVAIGADEAKLSSSIDLVDELWSSINDLKNKTIIVTTKYVEEHVAKAQAGGPIGMFARGGKLPGFGGGDKVRALLEAGEFVVNKNAVKKYGTAMFDAYNGMMAPVKMAFGGFISKKSRGDKNSFSLKNSSVGFSQLDDTIDKLSKTINTLNGVSAALNVEGGSFGMVRAEGESYAEFKERQQENIVSQNPLAADDFQIFLPENMRVLIADLKDNLKYVSNEDKESVAKVIDLLTPAGIKTEDIKARLSGRKLPKSEDVSDAVFNLEEERRDLEEKKEELAQYLEDMKKVREFYAEVRVLMVELSKLTVGARPYSLGTNEPAQDYKKKIARIKRDYINAKPILQSSGFDTSDMDSAFNAYLEKQQKLVSYQVSNTMRNREDGKLPGYFGEFISRDTRISRFDGKGKMPCWFQFPVDICIANRGHMMGRSAGNEELEMMDESKSSKLELDKARQAANISLADQKRKTLRDLDSYGIQSSLRSEAKSIKEDLTYESMEIPDSEPIQDAYKEMRASLGGISTKETRTKTQRLKSIFRELAQKYFNSLPKFATGGFVDNILARLSPGEFVLRADAVRQVGLPFLDALNNFKFPVPAFASGGLVEGPLPATVGNISPMQRDIQLNINITGAGEITEKQVRKWIYPAINKIQRLCR